VITPHIFDTLVTALQLQISSAQEALRELQSMAQQNQAAIDAATKAEAQPPAAPMVQPQRPTMNDAAVTPGA
jgi:hypothetical protein